jgi:hypothetical protein
MVVTQRVIVVYHIDFNVVCYDCYVKVIWIQKLQ